VVVVVEETEAHDSDTDNDSTQGESLIALVASLSMDTLQDVDKMHPK